MLKQALSLLTYRKKSTILMVGLLAFVFFLLGSVPALFTARDNAWFRAEADIRGVFDGIYLNLSEEQRQKLLGDALTKVGWITYYGECEVLEAGVSVPAGSFDTTAFELGRIDAVEGRLPQAEDEIALTESYKGRMRGVKIGDTITLLTEQGKEKTYILSGYIENYTSQWSEGLNVRPYVFDLPPVLVFAGSPPGEVTRTDALVYMPRLREMEAAQQQFGNEAKYLELSWEQEYFNELLYNRIPESYQKFQSVFSLAMLAGAATVVYITLSLYVESYRDVARKLYLTGAGTKDTLHLLLIWAALLAGAALLLSLGFHGIFFLAVKKHLQISVSLQSSVFTIGLILAGLLGLTFWFHKKKIEPLYGGSLSEKAEEIYSRRIELKKSVSFSFAAARVRNGRKRLFGVYVSVAVILALLLCVREEMNYKTGQSFQSKGFSFSVSRRSLKEDELSMAGGLILAKEKRGIPLSEVEEVRAMAGVESVSVQYFGQYPSLILQKGESAYADALYE